MKQQLIELWQSRVFQIGMDICRILLLIVCVLIFYKLVTEIDAVKQINDPIKYFEDKTNSRCECYIISNDTYKIIYPKINFTQLDELIIKNAT